MTTPTTIYGVYRWESSVDGIQLQSLRSNSPGAPNASTMIEDEIGLVLLRKISIAEPELVPHIIITDRIDQETLDELRLHSAALVIIDTMQIASNNSLIPTQGV